VSALLDEMRAVAHQDAAHIVDDIYAFLVSGRDEVQVLFAKVAGVKSLADEARLRDTSEKVVAGVLIARSALNMPAPVASTAPASHSVGFEAPAGPSAPQA